MKLKQLKEQRKAKLDALQAIQDRLTVDNRTKFTDEEKAKMTELRSEIKDLNETIQVLEDTQAEIRSEVDSENEAETRNAGAGSQKPAAGNGGAGAGNTAPAKNDPASNVQAMAGTSQRDAVPVFGTFGRLLQAVAQRANPSLSYTKRQELDGQFEQYQRAIGAEAQRRSVSTGGNTLSGEDGGILVQQEVQNQIWSRAIETASFAPLCREWTLGTNAQSVKIPALVDNDRTNGNRLGGVVVYWTEEGETALPANIKLRTIQVDLNKLLGFWYATDEVLSDAPLMESIARTAFGDEVAREVDNAILNGSGIEQPLGILNSPALVTITKESGQSAASGTNLMPANVAKMVARIPPKNLRSKSFRFVANPDTIADLPMMTFAVGTGGVPAYMPPGGMSVAPYGTLFGKEILSNEFSPARAAKGDIAAIDFDEYLLLKKGGVAWDQSMHVQFLYDQHVFRIKLRIGGQPMWDLPLTMPNSSTLSPFVTIEARP